MNNNIDNENSTVLGNVSGVNNDQIETLDTLDSPNVGSSTSTFFNDVIPSNDLNNNENEIKEEPPVAYTDPQVINNNLNNNYQPQNDIGVTPPVSLEPEKKPKKGGSKILFIIFVIVLMVGVGFGTYYVLEYTDLLSKKESITIETKSIEINVGETLSNDLSYYATVSGTSTSNCNAVDTSGVNTSLSGTYEYTVTCGDVSKKGQIIVKDVVITEILTKTVYKVKNDTLKPEEFIVKKEDGTTYEFVSESDVSTALSSSQGTYNIGIKVIKNGESTNTIGKLIMLEYPIKGYVVCDLNKERVEEVKASKEVTRRFAILSNDNSYANIADEITTFTFSDDETFKNYENTFLPAK